MFISISRQYGTCHGCCHPDVPGMAIQCRMLMMADQSSGYNSFQTLSLQIRDVFKRVRIWFPPYQDVSSYLLPNL